ncbi:hypothetical protein [Marinoscillum sp. MHG1-6]|uniref:hypothetical protein n=1 Tax=Marinoscillum sp. MHG1-6 TaxID=2959627 RepID=UPI0021581A56|nr:hypothetical protein [Marinoscillum sp. MHG1-6]
MDVLSRLASSQERLDQDPNKVLAQEIVQSNDILAIGELKALLQHKSTNILFDALKVLEVVGENDPELIRDLFDDLVPLLTHKTNKIVWIAMSAFCQITHYHPEKTFDHLPRILQIMDEGSVITRDKGFKILVGLYTDERYRDECKPLIREQLIKAPDNQFGMYTEKWMEVIQPSDLRSLITIVEKRHPELTSPSHIKRAQKNLARLLKRR